MSKHKWQTSYGCNRCIQYSLYFKYIIRRTEGSRNGGGVTIVMTIITPGPSYESTTRLLRATMLIRRRRYEQVYLTGALHIWLNERRPGRFCPIDASIWTYCLERYDTSKKKLENERVQSMVPGYTPTFLMATSYYEKPIRPITCYLPSIRHRHRV